jgi:HAD superfamily hydrolase (TIGR01509 family)
MPAWKNLCRDWLAAQGISAPDSLEQDLAPMTLSLSADYVIRVYGLGLGPDQIKREWEDMIFDRYAQTIPLKEGAAELVRALAAKGMRLAIATSCFPASSEALLERHGIRDCFPVIVYSDEVNRDKRFPDLYLVCARRLGVPPAHCVVFEDFPGALAGIRAAGMGMAAVYDESAADLWDTFKAKADFALRSLRELTGQAD